MKGEVISDRQGIMLVMLYVLGNEIILGTGWEAGRDIWLAILAAMALATPAVLIYARLLFLFPGKDLFDILEAVFGAAAGKAISVLFIWYAFHLGSLVLRNFGEFIVTIGLPETPMIVCMGFIALLCAWVAKEGIEVLGRMAEPFTFVIMLTLIVPTVLLIGKMNIDNIRPVLYNGVKPLITGSFTAFSFPFAETVVFTMVFSVLKRRSSSYKAYFFGLLLGWSVIFIAGIRNVMVLGVKILSNVYFPSYAAVSMISIGKFLERIEIVVTIAFLICGFVKIGICLLAVCNGVTKIFGYGEYRFIVIPFALLMVNLSYFIHNNTMEMKEFFKVYPYYAFPFQVILPVVVWIAAELKLRSGKQGRKSG